MAYNIIRSIIFFVAGLIILLFPKQVHKFQTYLIKKLHLKLKLKSDRKNYIYTGLLLIVISLIIFSFSINK